MTVAHLIGLTGRAGSGKDTIADILVSRHGFKKIALADPMKRFCREIFGFTDEQLWGPSEKRNEPDPRWDGLTPRKALQMLGTEWGRAMHPDVWVRRLIVEWSRLGDSVVVPDVRFQNELEAIRAAGGHVVRVTGHVVSALEGGVPGHVSESGVEGADATIDNSGSIETLPDRVAHALTIVERITRAA